jgi:hypothetical protein
MVPDYFRSAILDGEVRRHFGYEESGKILLSTMKDCFHGRACVVMGGGPSLPGELERLGLYRAGAGKGDPMQVDAGMTDEGQEVDGAAEEMGGSPVRGAGCKLHRPVLVSVNYHAFMLEGVVPDFMVYNDEPDSDPLLMAEIERHRAVNVALDESTDVRFDVEPWRGFSSSQTSAWLGCWWGCDPIILCGMDCYQGAVKYFHDWKDQPSHHYPLDMHVRPWIEEGRHKLDMKRVFVMGGPLQAVFKVWNPGKAQGVSHKGHEG